MSHYYDFERTRGPPPPVLCMTEDDSSVRCPVVEPGPDFPAPPLLPLPRALHNADLARVRELLAATPAPDLTQTDKLGQTPLVVAVRRSERDADRAAARAECVRLLLAAGADANVADGSGDPPLALAVMAGADGAMGTRCVEALLAAGADVNARCYLFKNSALHWAAASSNAAAARLLLDAKAELTRRNREKRTPLEEAEHCASAPLPHALGRAPDADVVHLIQAEPERRRQANLAAR